MPETAESKELRCNSWEWARVVRAMDDEAFVESVGPHDKSGQYEKAEPLRQISEQAAYAAAKPDQKVLKAGQWLPAKKNECPSVETQG